MSDHSLRMLLDASDRFASLSTPEQKWDMAQTVARDFGAVAVNIGAGSRRTGDLLWMRSNMSRTWLSDYVDQAFMTLDPFVAGAVRNTDPVLLNAGRLRRSEAASNKAFEMDHQLSEAGYPLCYGVPFTGTIRGAGGMVVFGFDREAARSFTEERASQMRLVAAVIAANVGPPEDVTAPGVVDIPTGRLTRREREVLALLADGHGNDGIADRLGVSEATVQKHLRSARQRLNVLSREQAVVRAVSMGLI
ncbi:LuxR C-terminal-related transcriptional regulator [Jannaschia sp. 2305UL9-9]|uniref:helix-turn-helix transcriptional regulator n=1 Tax=Jannaschia sp. 2305UL9-9 TaxID=3121638 RepID=UPI00352988A5